MFRWRAWRAHGGTDVVRAAGDHTGPLDVRHDAGLTAGERLGEPAFDARGDDGEAFGESPGRRRQPSDPG
jgi:hypothetical protein